MAQVMPVAPVTHIQAPPPAADPRLVARPNCLGEEVYNALAWPLLALEGVIFHPRGLAIGVPAPRFGSCIYMVIEVEKDGRRYDFKVYQVAREGEASMWLDAMSHASAGVGRRGMSSTKPVKVEFRNHSQFNPAKGEEGRPARVLGGQLLVRREIKINDVKLPFLPDDINFFVYPATWDRRSRISVESIVSAHGWKGMMSWDMCRRGGVDSKGHRSGPLHDVWVNDRTKEIYMPMDGQEAYLVVDFDDENVDMKVEVPARTDASAIPPFGFQWDLPKSGCKIKGIVFEYPKEVTLRHLTSTDGAASLGGSRTLHIKTTIQLDDVPFGTRFKEMTVDPVRLDLNGGRGGSAADAFPHLLDVVRQVMAQESRPLVPPDPVTHLPIWTDAQSDSSDESKDREDYVKTSHPPPPAANAPSMAGDPSTPPPPYSDPPSYSDPTQPMFVV